MKRTKSNRRNFMPEENKRGSGAGDAQSKFESSKLHARKAAEDLREAAGAVAGEYRGKAEEAWNDARGKAEKAWTDARGRAEAARRCLRLNRKPPRSSSCWSQFA